MMQQQSLPNQFTNAVILTLLLQDVVNSFSETIGKTAIDASEANYNKLDSCDQSEPELIPEV